MTMGLWAMPEQAAGSPGGLASSRQAVSGREAMAAAGQFRQDIAIQDFAMPELN